MNEWPAADAALERLLKQEWVDEPGPPDVISYQRVSRLRATPVTWATPLPPLRRAKAFNQQTVPLRVLTEMASRAVLAEREVFGSAEVCLLVLRANEGSKTWSNVHCAGEPVLSRELESRAKDCGALFVEGFPEMAEAPALIHALCDITYPLFRTGIEGYKSLLTRAGVALHAAWGFAVEEGLHASLAPYCGQADLPFIQPYEDIVIRHVGTLAIGFARGEG